VDNDEQVKRDALRELSEADRAYRFAYKRLASRRGLTKTPQRPLPSDAPPPAAPRLVVRTLCNHIGTTG
jgi:hypothetical protein